MRFVKKNPILEWIHHSAVSYKPPTILNYFWNFGILALFCLIIQVITGIFLAMHYIASPEHAFNSIEHIMRDVNYGWLIRYLHANGASMFFLVVYIHLFRGLYFGSFMSPRQLLWITGVLILFIMILTAFMGYVLPWGQMSFWAATVITNLASAIPYIGDIVVYWLWGGFAVGGPTLNRFFSFHYLMPFVLIALIISHILILREVKSNNPIGINIPDKIQFTPYYALKDLYGVIIFWLFLSNFLFFSPNYLGHTDNYIKANSMVTPTHIVPEWYFLPFYAILRSVPDKLGGVILLLLAIIGLIIFPLYSISKIRSSAFRHYYKKFFWFFFVDCIILGWIGGKNIETPFYEVGQAATIFYFIYLFLLIPSITYYERILWKEDRYKNLLVRNRWWYILDMINKGIKK